MLTIAELCMGYGGLGMGLELAGIDTELVWCAEIDPHASKVIAHHWPDVPNLGDLTHITDPPAVDIIAAGFPCQPVSTAGARKGVEDERWLIDDVCRVARSAGATTLVLENVGGLLTANGGDAMARVCQALAANGYDRWRWTTLRAADIGAPHGRLRWFCVAQTPDADGKRLEGRDARGGAAELTTPERLTKPDENVREHAPTDADGGQPERWGSAGELGSTPATQHGQGLQRQRTGDTAGDRRAAPADPDDLASLLVGVGRVRQDTDAHAGTDPDRCSGSQAWGHFTPAVERWAAILGRPAPAPTVDGRLNPVAVEFMMGLPEGHVIGVPDLSRAQQLKILGNGVVPFQAAEAIGRLTC